METLDIDEIKEELTRLRLAMLNAATMGEELDAWAAWCKMWDRKEALDVAARSSASSYAL